MNDLRRLNSGLQMIKQLVKQPEREGNPWARANQKQMLSKQPNPHNKKTRNGQ